MAEITLHSTDDRDGWRLAYDGAAARSVVNAWGMACELLAGRVRCTGVDWAARLPAGGSRTVGLQVVTRGDPPQAPQLSLG